MLSLIKRRRPSGALFRNRFANAALTSATGGFAFPVLGLTEATQFRVATTTNPRHVKGGLGEAMQRAIDKTDQMQARASAVEELQAAGTFDDLTSLGPPQDDIDRQLDQLGTKSAVDDELAQLKAEVGSGATPEPPQIGAGEGSS